MVHVRIGSDTLVLSWDEWEKRVAAGRIPADAWVRIDAITGEDWTPAGELELYRSLAQGRAAAFARAREAAPPPWLTALLVGVQVRIWWLAQSPELGPWMQHNGTKWTPPTLEAGEIWRVLTMGLLHTGLVHALMNLLWLGYTGWHLERSFGWRNLAVLYLASVTGGSLLSMAGAPDSPSLGASGGIFGLVAAAVILGFTRPELLPERSRRVFGFALLPYLLVMFMSGVANSGTDNWSHLGGLLTGGALALLVDPVGFERPGRWARSWHGAVLGGIALLLAGLWAAGPHLVSLRTEAEARHVLARLAGAPSVAVSEDQDAVQVQVPAGWRRGRTVTGEPAWITPAGARAWAVRVTEQAWPDEASAALRAWSDRLERLGVDVVFDPSEPTTLAGLPAVSRRASLATDPPVVLHVVVATRGLDVLQASWQTEPHLAHRLAPLHARLLDGVRWPLPEALLAARARADRAPKAAELQRRFGLALARSGSPDEGIPLLRAAITAQPSSSRAWANLLQALAWYPDHDPTPRDTLGAALAAAPTPEVAARAADLLDRIGDAHTAAGLLELAWLRAPGERRLHRAREARGLSNALRPTTSIPSTLAWDLSTGAPRDPAWLEARASQPPDLEEASAVGRARSDARARLADRIAVAPTAVDVAPLLALWWYGHPPADPEEAIAELDRAVRNPHDEWARELAGIDRVRAMWREADTDVLVDTIPHWSEP